MTTTNNNIVYELTSIELISHDSHYMATTLPSWLLFSGFLFLTGVLGMIFNRRNLLIMLMTIELMYLGVISSFIFYGMACHDSRGVSYGLLLLILAAAEAAIGLGMLIVLFWHDHAVEFEDHQHLNG